MLITKRKYIQMTIEDIKQIAKKAGDILLAAKRPRIMEKSGHANFVTETDERCRGFWYPV